MAVRQAYGAGVKVEHVALVALLLYWLLPRPAARAGTFSLIALVALIGL